MTMDDVKTLLRLFVAADSRYAIYRRNALKEAAGSEQSEKQEPYWKDMLESYQRTLESVRLTEARDVLGRMELGELPWPKEFDYGKIAQVFRTHVMDLRADQRESAKAKHCAEMESERFVCLICKDRGVVQVFNPEFVFMFREKYEEFRSCNFPGDWLGVSYSWWRRRRAGPMVHVALCCCESPRRQALNEERQKFIDGSRRSLPSCGMAVYDPDRMPLTGGSYAGSLQSWYADH
jgi:hypothetical protein